MAYEEMGIKGKLFLELDPSSIDGINQQLGGATSVGAGATQPQSAPQPQQAPQPQTAPEPPKPPEPPEVSLGKEDKEKQNDVNKTLGAINNGINMGVGAFMGVMSMGLEFIEKIWRMIVEYSPGLKEILDLFEVALMLVFMPIGTAIMIDLIPIVIDLLDGVMGLWDVMWDAYEGGGVGSMLSTALVGAMPLFFNAIRGALATLGDEGIFGAIARVIGKILDFIEQSGIQLVETLLKLTEITIKIMGFLLTHLPIFGALMGIMIGLQTAQLLATLLPKDVFGIGHAIGAVGIMAMAGATIGAGLQYMADGGTIHPRPGGSLYVGGDGGEIEYVVPRSRAEEFAEGVIGGGGGGGGVTVIVQGNVYGMDDFEGKVSNVITRELSTMRGRSTF